MTLSPQMHNALRYLARYERRGSWTKDVPGGRRTVDALTMRGLAAIDGGRVVLTTNGRKEIGA